MIYTAVHGQNKKDYIQLTLENQEDLKTLEVIRSIVSRTEYFPFIKSFNKNVFQTYLINDTFFPVQFLDEVRTRINQICPKSPGKYQRRSRCWYRHHRVALDRHQYDRQY